MNVNSLFASLIWSSVGFGLLIYGKKQTALLPFLGGLLMIVLSYFIASSPLVLSLASLAILGGLYVLHKMGY